jgi:hypothetical protein
MTDQTRYRIVCADGETQHGGTVMTPLNARLVAAESDASRDCGPHTVEPVEPVAPDPTCAQSSCIHCRNGKPGACPVRPYPGTVGT